MLELQQRNQYFIFNFDGITTEPQKYFEPTYWQQQQRIMGSAFGRGTTWFIQGKDIFGVNLALRHYYRGGLLGKINKDYYCFNKLELSRSFAEFHLLNRLHQAELPVPKPIAARIVKSKTGLYYTADLLTEKIEDAQDLTELLQRHSLSNENWQQIGKLIRQLHNMQICHTDLNAHNILVQHFGTIQQKYWLLDFDKCAEKKGNSWKIKNLERLHRSLQKEVKKCSIQYSEQNWKVFYLAYQQ